MESPRRLAIFGVLAFVVLFHVRLGWETTNWDRYVDFLSPFSLRPFTNQIDETRYQQAIKRGDRLLAVNDQPFRGLSTYLRELRQHQGDAPFRVTVQTGGAPARTIVIGFPGYIGGLPAATPIKALVLPLFYVGLAIATFWRRPESLLATGFAWLLLAFAQTPVWLGPFQEPVGGIASPMQWSDACRIPGVFYQAFLQASWPLAVVLAVLHFTPAERRRPGWLLATVLLFYPLLQAAFAISWSEDHRMLAPLYHAIEQSTPHWANSTLPWLPALTASTFTAIIFLHGKLRSGRAIAGALLCLPFLFRLGQQLSRQELIPALFLDAPGITALLPAIGLTLLARWVIAQSPNKKSPAAG